MEVERCNLFVGMLGERYGWVPDNYDVSDEPELEWLKEYPPGASVTELEMHSAALSDSEAAQERAFFFLRDNSFMRYVLVFTRASLFDHLIYHLSALWCKQHHDTCEQRPCLHPPPVERAM